MLFFWFRRLKLGVETSNNAHKEGKVAAIVLQSALDLINLLYTTSKNKKENCKENYATSRSESFLVLHTV